MDCVSCTVSFHLSNAVICLPLLLVMTLLSAFFRLLSWLRQTSKLFLMSLCFHSQHGSTHGWRLVRRQFPDLVRLHKGIAKNSVCRHHEASCKGSIQVWVFFYTASMPLLSVHEYVDHVSIALDQLRNHVPTDVLFLIRRVAFAVCPSKMQDLGRVGEGRVWKRSKHAVSFVKCIHLRIVPY